MIVAEKSERNEVSDKEDGAAPRCGILKLALKSAIHYASPPNPDLSSGLIAGAEGRLAPFAVTILASGYDNGPAAGPGRRGFHRPRGSPSLGSRDGSRWSG